LIEASNYFSANKMLKLFTDIRKIINTTTKKIPTSNKCKHSFINKLGRIVISKSFVFHFQTESPLTTLNLQTEKGKLFPLSSTPPRTTVRRKWVELPLLNRAEIF